MTLDRKATAITGPEHLYWLHYRTLEPFIVSRLGQCAAPLLDLGCGNKPYQRFYPDGPGNLGVDVAQSSLHCVDIVFEPGGALPLEDERFATVLCTQVLEHVEDPYLLIREACRVLRPGGTLILTVPFIWELHERPHDFLRFSEYWLTKQLMDAGFDIQELQRQGGDLATIGQLITLSLAMRQIHLPGFLQTLFNKFWAYLDRKSHTNHMPLNYGLVCVKRANAHKEAA